MDIFELAKAKKLFGGGKREGTAIPVGQPVERIYFNTNNTAEETNALLSQLTYMQTPLSADPIHPIFAYIDPNGNGYTGKVIYAIHIGNAYFISCATDLINQVGDTLYSTSGIFNGWNYKNLDNTGLTCMVGAVVLNSVSLTEWNGIPVGAENEKIKNVLSITPF